LNLETSIDGWQLVLTKKNAKIGQKGSRGDPLLEFWDPPHISGTVEPRNFKFGTEAGGNQ